MGGFVGGMLGRLLRPQLQQPYPVTPGFNPNAPGPGDMLSTPPMYPGGASYPTSPSIATPPFAGRPNTGNYGPPPVRPNPQPWRPVSQTAPSSPPIARLPQTPVADDTSDLNEETLAPTPLVVKPQGVLRPSGVPGPELPEAPSGPSSISRLPRPPAVNVNVAAPPPDVNASTLRDVNQDYQRTRETVGQMPRKNDYRPGMAQAIAGLVGGYGANLASMSPRWYLRAGAPQIAQIAKLASEKKVQGQTYPEAMQDYSENLGKAQGLGATSTNQAKLEDTLATGQAHRETYRAQAELARQKPSIEANKGMMDLNSEQARLLGYSEDQIKEAEDTGVPIRAPKTLAQHALDNATKEAVQESKAAAYLGKAQGYNERMVKIAEMQDKTKRDLAREMDNLKRDITEANNKAAQQRTNTKAGTSRANTQDIIKARKDLEDGKRKAQQLKDQTIQKSNQILNQGLKESEAFLKDAAGNYHPPEYWQDLAKNGDKEASARIGHFMENRNRLYQQHKDIVDSAEAGYNGLPSIKGGGESGGTGGTPSAPGKPSLSQFDR